LHVNNGKYFVIICFSKIATTIITSKKLVRMGRKICLFVYYAKFISVKLWMVEEGATLKGGLEHWMVEGKIKRGILK
jgi:hypothetical protein